MATVSGQSTRMLKAECAECGYTIRLTKKWADVGLPSCPTDGAALTLDGSGEGAEGTGLRTLPATLYVHHGVVSAEYVNKPAFSKLKELA
jgi:hypothetical protein